MSREVLSPTELRMPTVASVAAGSLVTLSLTPAAVATIVAAKQTFTVAGLNAGDSVVPLSNPNTTAAALCGAEVSAANTLRRLLPPEHAITDRNRGDAEADLFDDPGHVPAEHERRLTENAGHSVSFTGLPVDRIDPRRVHPHEHLGGQRRRHGAFLDLEYRGVAEAVLNDGLHGCRCGVLGHFSTQPSRGKWQVYPFGIRSR